MRGPTRRPPLPSPLFRNYRAGPDACAPLMSFSYLCIFFFNFIFLFLHTGILVPSALACFSTFSHHRAFRRGPLSGEISASNWKLDNSIRGQLPSSAPLRRAASGRAGISYGKPVHTELPRRTRTNERSLRDITEKLPMPRDSTDFRRFPGCWALGVATLVIDPADLQMCSFSPRNSYFYRRPTPPFPSTSLIRRTDVLFCITWNGHRHAPGWHGRGFAFHPLQALDYIELVSEDSTPIEIKFFHKNVCL